MPGEIQVSKVIPGPSAKADIGPALGQNGRWYDQDDKKE